MITPVGRIFLVLVFSALTGCAVGPAYQRPAVDVPATFKEGSGWKLAEPQDHVARENWWEIYQDPLLNDLVRQVEVSNQNVRAMEAQYRQANALLAAARAGYFPTVSANLSATRGQAAATPPAPVVNADRLGLSAAWEADVWGRIGRSLEANQASAQATFADLQSALLSARAALVQAYLQLRINDTQRQLLDRTVAAYERSLQITRNRYESGVAGRIDVSQAEAQLNSALAQAIDLGVQRAQLEHAIALLIGKAPASFALAPSFQLPPLPVIPALVPSELLERRPDIAAAERRVAAANAQVGVAQSAFFPSLVLNAAAGYQGSSFAGLIALPNRFWSLGPTLAATLFDGGAHKAQKEQALAAFDKSAADYRQSVLTALQEVEDQLAALRILKEETNVQSNATRSAAEAVMLADNQYQAGTVSYLNVLSAQTVSLNAEKASVDIKGRSLLASVSLLKALGGGWK